MQYIDNDMVVGLGTGSTADYFLLALAEAMKSGVLRGIRGIPTSRQSHERAEQLGIPLTTLAEHPRVDITVDGADEIAPTLDLIKGLGGALLREKIVAQHSARLVIIADQSKRVAHLGEKSPLPVEVAQFAWESHIPFLCELGCEPSLRQSADGRPYITDNHNFIFDCRFPRINYPPEIQAALDRRAGILESGLFLNLAHTILIADDNGVETLQR